jgi:hypothetical protein
MNKNRDDFNLYTIEQQMFNYEQKILKSRILFFYIIDNQLFNIFGTITER